MKSKCVVPCVRVFRGINPKTWGSIGRGQAPAGAARGSKKRWPLFHLEVRYSFRTSTLVFLAQLVEHRTFNARVPSSNLGEDTICTISVVVTSCPSKALSWVRVPHGTPPRRTYYFRGAIAVTCESA